MLTAKSRNPYSSQNTGSNLGWAPVIGSISNSKMSFMDSFQRSTTGLSAWIFSAKAIPFSHS